MTYWTLQRRIAFGFGGLCALLVALSVVAIYRMQQAAIGARLTNDLYIAQSVVAEQMADASSELAIAVRGYDSAPTPANWDKVVAAQAATTKAYQDAEAFSAPHPTLTALREGLAKARPDFER